MGTWAWCFRTALGNYTLRQAKHDPARPANVAVRRQDFADTLLADTPLVFHDSQRSAAHGRRPVAGCYDSRMNRALIIAGLLLLAGGLFWSRLRSLPLFRLPGDIMIDRPGFKFFFPITTMLIASIALSIVLWLLQR